MSKCVKTLLSIAVALAAIAGAAYVIYTYWDKIAAKLAELKAKCPCCCEDVLEEAEAEETPAEEAPAEEAPAAEAPAEEAPAAEAAVTEEDFAD